MENENIQNKKTTMTLLFEGNNGETISVAISDKKLQECRGFAAIQIRDWAEPIVPLDWRTEKALKQKIGTILDAAIVNVAQKNAIADLIEHAIYDVRERLSSAAKIWLSAANRNAKEAHSLGSSNLQIIPDSLPPVEL